ncbi:Mitotic spindle checkpoint protein [Ceraceosorus bombacis]|uniref:Mitotic spindle checkpoint protein n=1 Tax=Ceraceosorus bombacis TaxID=401625 RepID=A0A0P1BIR9_9BASI|nr:Mitotic spindle checkpoint protein [Ceraceosorus bombacis]
MSTFARHDSNASRPGPSSLVFEGDEMTYNETIDAICQFLTLATHTVLYFRQVYPPEVFTRKSAYSVPVWACRHPGVCDYIDELVRAAKVQVLKGLVSSVHLALMSTTTQSVLERYRFDLEYMIPLVVPRDRDLAIPGNLTKSVMEIHLRSFMQKLISLDAALEDVEEPEDLTWAFVLVPKEGRVPETDDKSGNEPREGPWVPFDDGPLQLSNPTASSVSDSQSVDDRQQSHASSPIHARPAGRRSDNANDASVSEQDQPSILPVKSLDTGVINLMLYVEEHPLAKRQSSLVFSQSTPISSRRRGQEGHGSRSGADKGLLSGASQLPAEVRDLDAPVPHPEKASKGGRHGSRKAGAADIKERNGKGRATNLEEDEDAEARSESDDASESGRSADSVGSFAGYGGNAGGAGMAGTRM